MLDVVCMGEAVWDLRIVPRRSAAASLGTIDARPGGGAVNTALALEALGFRTEVCAAIGGDPLGRALGTSLRHAGVGVRSTGHVAGRTGVVFLTEEGVVGYRAPAEETASLLRALPTRPNARALHVASLLPRRGASPFSRAAEIYRRARRLVTVDLNARPRLWPPGSRVPWGVIAAADVVKCSHADLAALALPGPPGARVEAMRARMRSAAVLLVTDGAAATRVLGPFAEARLRPATARLRDAAGAGDAFCASVLAGLLRDPRQPRSRASWIDAVVEAHRFAQHVARRG